jgi:hypothetical protein
MGKIIIGGTGRSGTSFLIQLFSHLGMGTGYPNNVNLEHKSDAGLEGKKLNDNARIIKNFQYTVEIDKTLNNHQIDHFIVPVRKLEDTAKSRQRVSEELKINQGGYWGANNLGEQINYNSKVFYNLIESLVRHNTPFTMLPFPYFIYDESIIYDKLKWLFEEYNVSEEKYLEVFNKLKDENKIHIK